MWTGVKVHGALLRGARPVVDTITRADFIRPATGVGSALWCVAASRMWIAFSLLFRQSCSHPLSTCLLCATSVHAGRELSLSTGACQRRSGGVSGSDTAHPRHSSTALGCGRTDASLESDAWFGITPPAITVAPVDFADSRVASRSRRSSARSSASNAASHSLPPGGASPASWQSKPTKIPHASDNPEQRELLIVPRYCDG
jgi:hypothetical protein